MRMKRGLLLLIASLSALWLYAQKADFHKMSRLVKQAVWEQERETRGVKHGVAGAKAGRTPSLLAFVRTVGEADEVFAGHGCEVFASAGDIHIVRIPLSEAARLSRSPMIDRIEAGSRCTALLDTVPFCVNSQPVAAGTGLPQAYTGRGVVVGVQDIGFDLTHPNFYSADLSTCRIKAFWDQLGVSEHGEDAENISMDSPIESHHLPVGLDFTSSQSLLRYAHSRDGRDFMHGTHTLGIAAGTGCGSPYRGMAWESDICLVANATTNNARYIAEEDLYLYTTAMDALGFKYIFDYAERQGKPCVISFSEGSYQDLDGDDQLFYAFLESLTGPGRIIVASAGNDGAIKSYFHKERGTESAGTFLRNTEDHAYLLMRSSGDFTIRTVVYTDEPDTVAYQIEASMTDTLEIADTLILRDGEHVFLLSAYPSCYDASQRACELFIQTPRVLGRDVPLSVEVVGREADVEVFRRVGHFAVNDLNPLLDGGVPGVYTVHSPGSAPSVICVGATSYRNGFMNAQGTWMAKTSLENGGVRGSYSSPGPTLDGRIKPDVLAPGSCVVSSMSSFYLANEPKQGDLNNNVSYFDHQGRTYAWNSSSGTSMSTPVVAGAIALWLQADPTLTPAQVMDILRTTCRRVDDAASLPNNNDGYGEIDVYKGLLQVLAPQADGLRTLLTDHQPQDVRFTLHGSLLTVEIPSLPPSILNTASSTLSIYTLTGRQLLRKTFDSLSSAFHVDLSSLPTGVLAVQLSSSHPSLQGSTLIRHH